MIITKKTSPHNLFWGAMPAFQEHGQGHVLHARWDRQTHLHQSQLHLETDNGTLEPEELRSGIAAIGRSHGKPPRNSQDPRKKKREISANVIWAEIFMLLLPPKKKKKNDCRNPDLPMQGKLPEGLTQLEVWLRHR